MINAYNKVALETNTPSDTNKKVIRSVILYLEDYQNTALTKTVRLISLNKGVTILEYLIADLNSDIPESERSILFYGFLKILTKAKEASINVNTLYNLKDEIGFLKILT